MVERESMWDREHATGRTSGARRHGIADSTSEQQGVGRACRDSGACAQKVGRARRDSGDGAQKRVTEPM